MSEHTCCQHTSQHASVCQTLDEMEFERGLWSAALDGDLARITHLLQDGKDPNTVDTSGYTPLHYAARNGHVEVCRLLLQNSACVNAATRSGSTTALHRAAYCGHGNVVTLLLKHGAKVASTDNDQKTALHKACENGHGEVAKLLLCHTSSRPTALISMRDQHGKTAAEYVPESNTNLRTMLEST